VSYPLPPVHPLPPRRRRTVLAGLLAAALTVLSLATGVVTARPASAAALTEITNFGSNPTGLRMHLYVPDRVGARPAIVVAVHYCTGSGPVFFSGTEFRSLADQFGFIVIYPSATRSGNCFDVSSPGALTHNSTSDPAGIVSMVRWVEQNRNGDPARVFVTGASSGAMMTNVLLGDYPDVFKAGAAFMGVPFFCFATTDGSLWNSTCANGQRTDTPQGWGNRVRNAFPGFTGTRPRMQLWHGTADTTLRFPNFGEEIKQWTNVLGVSQTPVLTDHPQSTWTHTRYGSNTGTAAVEAYSIANVGHSLPTAGMAAQAIRFFGLSS
jgi:acetylxylan esterase